MTNAKWDESRTQTLIDGIGKESPVSVATVEKMAGVLEVSTRSIASKLRKLGYEVVSMAKDVSPTFSEAEAASLEKFVNKHANKVTYADVAQNWGDGKFSAKQIQGKLLSMELTGLIKPAEKLEVVHKYTEAEEESFIKMCNAGNFVEDIAAALNKTVNSVRGKALSLLRTGSITKIPSQKESLAKDKVDPIEALGDISNMTVAEIAAKTDKTERGIRTTLTRRGISCKDYDGEAKKAKAAAKAA